MSDNPVSLVARKDIRLLEGSDREFVYKGERFYVKPRVNKRNYGTNKGKGLCTVYNHQYSVIGYMTKDQADSIIKGGG